MRSRPTRESRSTIVVDTIKSALLTAYRHTEGHEADARIDIDRKTGDGQGDGARDSTTTAT